MANAPLQQQADAIAAHYLTGLPDDYTGRHSAVADPDTVAILLRAFGSGLNQRDSCAAAGISPDTFQRWMQLAVADPTSAYAAFAVALKGARAQGKLRRLEKIEKHGDKEWTALAWGLERTDPEQFALRKDSSDSPKVIVQIGAGAGDVKVGVLVQSPTFASEPATVTTDLHSLTAETGSDNTRLC